MLNFQRRFISYMAMPVLAALWVLASKNPQEYDFSMWKGAQEDYSRTHKLKNFAAEHVGLEPYQDIPNLKEKLFGTAERAGRFKGAMLIGKRGSHNEGNRAIWFSTVVDPDDMVGQEMELDDRIALAFWRRDKDGFKLLWIDTVPDLGVSWGLQNLKTVLRQF